MDEIARFFSGSIPIAAHQQQQQFAISNALPQMVILSHKTHSEEVLSKNGIQRTVQIVVKNSPFYFQIGLANSNNLANKIDFNQVAFDSFLLYDHDGNKEVDYVKVKPIEFKSTPSENGQQLEVELRIKVLTSQHEDMLFKVKIQGFNPLTHEEIPGLTLYTSPIKVISKPEQLKKRAPSKKRSLTEMLVDTVSRIEKKQEDQQKLIERLITQQTTAILTTPALPVNNNDKRSRLEDLSLPLFEEFNATTTSSKPDQNKKDEELPEFEEAFVNLIKAYNTIKPEEKPETVRKLIRSSSTRETERLSELLDLLWTEGLQKEPSFARSNTNMNRLASNSMHSSNEGCLCSDCPHKVELERIDEFYKEFLSSGQVPGYSL